MAEWVRVFGEMPALSPVGIEKALAEFPLRMLVDSWKNACSQPGTNRKGVGEGSSEGRLPWR
jgi:hypothetical protein